MSTAEEEVTAAVRELAAHEVRIVMLSERSVEMRDQLDQGGLRLHPADSKVGDTSGHEEVREDHV